MVMFRCEIIITKTYRCGSKPFFQGNKDLIGVFNSDLGLVCNLGQLNKSLVRRLVFVPEFDNFSLKDENM